MFKKFSSEMARRGRGNPSTSYSENVSVIDTTPVTSIRVTAPLFTSNTMGETTVTAPIFTPVSMMSVTQPNTTVYTPPTAGMASPSTTNPILGSSHVNMNFKFGMPTHMMVGPQKNSSMFADNAGTQHSPARSVSEGIPSWSTQPTLTTTSLLALRQQIDDANHDMVNMLTQQTGTVFNPLI